MADAVKPQIKSRRRWVQVLLVCSLALNLLVAGIIAGAVLSDGKWGPRHGAHLSPVGGPLSRALSHDDRHAIARKMRAGYGDRDATRAARRAHLDALVQDLTAVPFDSETVRTRLDAIQSGFSERQSLGRDMLIERLSEMSDSERAEYARRLMKGLRRGH